QTAAMKIILPARRPNVATRRSARAAVGPGTETTRLGLKPGAVTAGALAPGHYSPGRAHFHRFRVPPCGMKTRSKACAGVPLGGWALGAPFLCVRGETHPHA